MDELYIEKCKAATNIQEIRKGFTTGDAGDRWLKHGRIQTYSGPGVVYCGGTWLPRQDQLQAIYTSTHLRVPGSLMGDFMRWLTGYERYKNDNYIYYPEELDWFYRASSKTTMEQLWLAFVMHELYGKTWDGEGWVAANAS